MTAPCSGIYGLSSAGTDTEAGPRARNCAFALRQRRERVDAQASVLRLSAFSSQNGQRRAVACRRSRR